MQLKCFTMLLLCACGALSLNAGVWTVSNDPERPAQFTDVQEAIDNASPGDTLRIAGSSTPYGGFVLYIPLVFIGEGANNPDGESTELRGAFQFNRLNSSISSSGSQFHGIRFSRPSTSYQMFFTPSFSGGMLSQYTLENILFDRCWFRLPVSETGSGTISSTVYRHCVFELSISGSSSIAKLGNVFTNCVFYHSSVQFSYFNALLDGGVIIRNSLFLDRTSNSFNANGIIVENCIFYKAEPTGAENSVFNNNITFFCNDNTLPYGNNAGSGNLEGVDPMFIDYPAIGGDFSWDHDYGLQAGSPAIGTGTDGSDIGLTGGNAPVNNIPGWSRIPVVTALTLPAGSVPIGGSLEVNIEAKTRN